MAPTGRGWLSHKVDAAAADFHLTDVMLLVPLLGCCQHTVTIDDAVEFAEKSPPPEPADALTDVYAE